jgi:hypothetical protein
MGFFDFVKKYIKEPVSSISNFVGSNAMKHLGRGVISGLENFGLINKEQASEGENVLSQIQSGANSVSKALN